MRKFFPILVLCFVLQGCSLLPRLTFDTPGTVPQTIDRSKSKEICKGDGVWSDSGRIISCSKGYFNYSENYNKIERTMTVVERVKSWINNILGWGIPGLLVILLLFPGAFTIVGAIIGRLFERIYGAGSQTLKRVVTAVQKTRKEGKDINQSLEAELDVKDKIYIAKIKQDNNIK